MRVEDETTIMAAMGEAMKIDDQSKDEKDEEFHQNLDLPHDLITHGIIIRLPIKYLMQFKSVSKQWYSTLSSPHFGNAHFKFSPFYQPLNPMVNYLFVKSGNDYFIYSYDDENVVECDFDVDCDKGLFKLEVDFDGLRKDDIFVIGSCNGLVCLYSSLGYLIVWNPVIIHQWVKFSCPFSEDCKKSTWGFGYVSSVDDYKVVRMNESKLNRGEIIVCVFSLRTQKWKQVYDERLGNYILLGASFSQGLLINESLYWIMHRQQGGEYKQDILGFDLVLERLKTVHSIVPGDSYLGWVRFLCCMGGCLSMGRFTNRGDVSVSMLKQNGQVDYIGLYRDLDLGSCCSAVGFTRDGKFFIQLGQRELGLVDPYSSPKSYSTLCNFKGEGFIDIKGYAPSLVSPLAVATMQE